MGNKSSSEAKKTLLRSMELKVLGQAMKGNIWLHMLGYDQL